MKSILSGRISLALVFACSLSVGLARAQSPPTFEGATFVGGPGDQEGRAIVGSSSNLYVAGGTFAGGGSNGLLVKFGIPAVAPVWGTTLRGTTVFNSLALTGTTLYPLGYALPP